MTMTTIHSPAFPVEDTTKIHRLPNELFDAILSGLANHDIKNLRLTCRLLRSKAHLRFNRVFVSANPRNIEVLYSIANHEIFRRGVSEIIWDDATLLKLWLPDQYFEEEYRMWDEENGCPNWFELACNRELETLDMRKGIDADRPDHLARQKQLDANLSLSDCWKFYHKLLQEQDEVISSKSDACAFR